jgi:subtilase family serine protease
VNQTGGSHYPRVDPGWATEISLDVEWAHAIAPGAKILLVEATDAELPNLLVAEDYAAAHARYISNSWGDVEAADEGASDARFVHPAVSIFFAAGDDGTPAHYPSSSPNVISVGGTTLHFDAKGKLIGETGWSDSGGGCSRYEAAPAPQAAFADYDRLKCKGRRATPDISLDADPESGVSVYDSTSFNGVKGWRTVGGTSAAAPMIAARAAMTGAVVGSAYIYGPAIRYRDITVGNNGARCRVGADLVTGRGSWTH